MIYSNSLMQRRGERRDAETQRGKIMKENELSDIIVDTALYIHKNLGSGLLENVYEVILTKLLAQKDLHVQRQVPIPIKFERELYNPKISLLRLCVLRVSA